jgi:hypothetical protein
VILISGENSLDSAKANERAEGYSTTRFAGLGDYKERFDKG